MQARQHSPSTFEEAVDLLLEVRLRKLDKELWAKLPWDRRSDSESSKMNSSENLGVRLALFIVCYAGCFNLVSRSDAEGGPYAWAALEFVLVRGNLVDCEEEVRSRKALMSQHS
ncbi:hypothetical protein PM082_011561 [Marasmius tenuissimus]|nr:hypothetical protein PM082_011561 [Marasmius tenuissimus]